jgi:DNA-binding HxlR family transcriptional regulator
MKQAIKTTNDLIEYRLTEEGESVIPVLHGGHCSDKFC